MNSTASLKSSVQTSGKVPSFSLDLTEPAPSLETTPSGTNHTVNVFDYQVVNSPCPSDAGSIGAQDLSEEPSDSLSPKVVVRSSVDSSYKNGTDAGMVKYVGNLGAGSRTYTGDGPNAYSAPGREGGSQNHPQPNDSEVQTIDQGRNYQDDEVAADPTGSENDQQRKSSRFSSITGVMIVDGARRKFKQLLGPKKDSATKKDSSAVAD